MGKLTVKDQVLTLLNEHRGQFASGQDLADQIGVSRTAVWKAINSLREKGYSIEGSTKTGYRLAEDTDVLSAVSILGQLDGPAADFCRVECEKEITSTNLYLIDRARQGEAEGLVMLAESQTAGRGRRGRNFYSPGMTGLYLSVLLRPTLSVNEAVSVTTVAAVAAAIACEKVNAGLSDGEIGIKWVNDLFLHGKKFCGILTEAGMSMETGGLDYAVLGIGFNLTPPDGGWPENIADTACALYEGPCPAGTRNALAAAFLNAFIPIYQALPKPTYLEEYRRRSLALGREVMVINADGSKRPAKALDVDDHCHLIVQFADADRPVALDSGEISIKL